MGSRPAPEAGCARPSPPPADPTAGFARPPSLRHPTPKPPTAMGWCQSGGTPVWFPWGSAPMGTTLGYRRLHTVVAPGRLLDPGVGNCINGLRHLASSGTNQRTGRPAFAEDSGIRFNQRRARCRPLSRPEMPAAPGNGEVSRLSGGSQNLLALLAQERRAHPTISSRPSQRPTACAGQPPAVSSGRPPATGN